MPVQTSEIIYTFDNPRSSRNKLTRLPHKLTLCKPNFSRRLKFFRLHRPSQSFRLRLQLQLDYPKSFGIRNPGLKCVDSACVFSRVMVLLGADLSVSFGFVIIVQHYSRRLHCSFCVISYCHAFSCVDGL